MINLPRWIWICRADLPAVLSCEGACVGRKENSVAILVDSGQGKTKVRVFVFCVSLDTSCPGLVPTEIWSLDPWQFHALFRCLFAPVGRPKGRACGVWCVCVCVCVYFSGALLVPTDWLGLDFPTAKKKHLQNGGICNSWAWLQHDSHYMDYSGIKPD